jgi:hypothetical protein
MKLTIPGGTGLAAEEIILLVPGTPATIQSSPLFMY